MTRRVQASFFALFATLGTSFESYAQGDGAVQVHVDATSPAAVLAPVWSYFGYDESNYTTHEESQQLLQDLVAAHNSPVRTRTHFLFNSGDGSPQLKWGSTNIYTEDEAGGPIYDYEIIDSIMDATVRAGAYPLFEIGFMPEALSTQPSPYQNSSPYVLDGGAFYPPKDYEKWANLVRAYAEHVKERYPGAEESWQWELWNEPDISYFKGTFEEFARLYDFTENALHSVFPNAPLGGPATVRANESFLADFLDHCENGENAVTGETGTRLDLVTFHAKGGTTLIDRDVRMDLGNQLWAHQVGFETVASSEKFSATPIVITEADPDGCAACSSNTALHLDYRHSPAYGAYVVAMMKRSIDLAAEVGVDLKGVLTWAFTFPDSPYFAGYRSLATNGIHLPVMNAFKLLGQMEGQRLPVVSSGALPLGEIIESSVRDTPDVDALAARSGDDIYVLVYNYHDDLVDAEPAEVAVEVKLPDDFAPNVAITHQRVDNAHGDAYSVWEELGRPEEPSTEERNALVVAMDDLDFRPRRVVERDSQSVALSFSLPRHGLSLLKLTRTNEAPTAEDDPVSGEQTGCSCSTSPGAPYPPARPLLTFVVVAILGLRRVSHPFLKTARARTKVPANSGLSN